MRELGKESIEDDEEEALGVKSRRKMVVWWSAVNWWWWIQWFEEMLIKEDSNGRDALGCALSSELAGIQGAYELELLWQ